MPDIKFTTHIARHIAYNTLYFHCHVSSYKMIVIIIIIVIISKKPLQIVALYVKHFFAL